MQRKTSICPHASELPFLRSSQTNLALSRRSKTAATKMSGSKTNPRSRNNMKSTAVSNARREQSKVSRNITQTSHQSSSLQCKGTTISPNLCVNSSKNMAGKTRNVKVEQATCSSSLKDRKINPEPEGDSDMKVCRYSYCSFNGHLRSLSPPLKSFVSERRRALKSTYPPKCAEIKGREESTISHGEMCHEFGSREGIKQIGDLNPTAKQIKPDIIAESDERFGGFFNEISRDEATSQESIDHEESINRDSVCLHNNLESLCIKQSVAENGSSFEGNQKTSTYDAMERKKATLEDIKSLSNEDANTQIGNIGQASVSVDEMATLVDSNECKTIKHVNQDHMLNQEEDSDGARSTKTTQTEDESNKECDDRIRLNPRAPQLLPIEQEPGAEEVNLRHQELEARKNPEEWMVDYAMRQAIMKGVATARQRKVALMVQAFETVVPKPQH